MNEVHYQIPAVCCLNCQRVQGMPNWTPSSSERPDLGAYKALIWFEEMKINVNANCNHGRNLRELRREASTYLPILFQCIQWPWQRAPPLLSLGAVRHDVLHYLNIRSRFSINQNITFRWPQVVAGCFQLDPAIGKMMPKTTYSNAIYFAFEGLLKMTMFGF